MPRLPHLELRAVETMLETRPTLSASIGTFHALTHLRLYDTGYHSLLAAAQLPSLVSVYCEFDLDLFWSTFKANTWAAR